MINENLIYKQQTNVMELFTTVLGVLVIITKVNRLAWAETTQ